MLQIYKVAAVVMTVCALLLTSCGKTEPEVQLTVKAQYETVDAKAGQMFISVKSNSSWTLSLSEEGTGTVVDWASLNVTSGTGDKNVILSYDLNSDEVKVRKIKVNASSGPVSAFCMIEQSPAGKHEENEPDTEPEKPSGPDLAKTGWMELPAMDDPDLDYYSHSFKMNGKNYRNYSFGWSQKDLVAHWAAYPLCSMYTKKNVGRTDAWAYDPLLGTDSSAPFGGYGGSYARGHQVPSADRLCCYEANAQTFYGTNMTPQQNDHNGGIWADLEIKVRNIANNSDTTYVVTGVITEGAKTFTKDSDGKKMTVPVAYFKAVLRYSKSSTLGKYNAAAFYLEHRAYSEKLGKQHSMSIDELEELTGMDFFVNLPAAAGADQAAKIEAADPADSSLWW